VDGGYCVRKIHNATTQWKLFEFELFSFPRPARTTTSTHPLFLATRISLPPLFPPPPPHPTPPRPFFFFLSFLSGPSRYFPTTAGRDTSSSAVRWTTVVGSRRKRGEELSPSAMMYRGALWNGLAGFPRVTVRWRWWDAKRRTCRGCNCLITLSAATDNRRVCADDHIIYHTLAPCTHRSLGGDRETRLSDQIKSIYPIRYRALNLTAV